MTASATPPRGQLSLVPSSGRGRHHYIQASDISEEIIEYANEGNSAEEIAHELGVSAASVRRVLENQP